MNARLHKLVWVRANSYCEYCHLHQQYDQLRFHIDHILAQKHHGSSTPDNLALACAHCSFAKGSNIAGRDPETRRLTRLLNPRLDVWQEHFRWRQSRLVGLTAIGRTTVFVLNMNDLRRIAVRELLRKAGLFPPESAPSP